MQKRPYTFTYTDAFGDFARTAVFLRKGASPGSLFVHLRIIGATQQIVHTDTVKICQCHQMVGGQGDDAILVLRISILRYIQQLRQLPLPQVIAKLAFCSTLLCFIVWQIFTFICNSDKA